MRSDLATAHIEIDIQDLAILPSSLQAIIILPCGHEKIVNEASRGHVNISLFNHASPAS